MSEALFSEKTVREFIGWLSADIPALNDVLIPDLADSWERFKAAHTGYDFEYEAGRIVDALKLEGATMTLICALREAFDAGAGHRGDARSDV